MSLWILIAIGAGAVVLVVGLIAIFAYPKDNSF